MLIKKPMKQSKLIFEPLVRFSNEWHIWYEHTLFFNMKSHLIMLCVTV